MLLAGSPPVVQVHPTRRCNLSCEHCYTSSGPAERGELSLALLGAALEDAVRLGYRQLAVSGGEPLLYRELAGLLARARALGMITTLTTNGTLLTPARWQPLAPLVDFVAVSLDGLEAEHDRLRRRRGTFVRTLANLHALRAAGTHFGLLFTLTQHNVDAVEPLVELALQHGARGLQIHPLSLEGRARAALPDARPDEQELLAALGEAARLGRAAGLDVHVDALHREQLLAHRAALVPPSPPPSLLAIAPVLVVDASAAVVPLTHELPPSLHLGSLHRAPLAALAATWLAGPPAAALAAACARTWEELAAAGGPQACYWYDEVAARTQPRRLPRVSEPAPRPVATSPSRTPHTARAPVA